MKVKKKNRSHKYNKVMGSLIVINIKSASV